MNKPVELIIGCQGIITSDNNDEFSQKVDSLIESVLEKNGYEPSEISHSSTVLEDPELSNSKMTSHMFIVTINIKGGYSAERKNIMNALIGAGKDLGTYTSWLVHINGNSKETK